MPRATPFVTSFAAGEISPRLQGRTDLVRYQSGAQKVRNLLVLPQGPLLRRRGTRYIGNAYSNTYKSRLIPFVFSRTDRIVIEASEGVFRFIKDGAYILSGSTPLELVTPYAIEDIFALAYAQQADVLIITHQKYKPRKLSRISDTSWRLEELSFVDGPYLDANTLDNVKITATVTTDTIQVIAQAAVFTVADIGSYIEFKENNRWRLGQITSFIDSKNVLIGGDTYDRVIDVGENVFVDISPPSNITTTPGAFSAYNAGSFLRETRDTGSPKRWRLLLSSGAPSTATYESSAVSPVLRHAVSKGERIVIATLTASTALFAPTDVGRHVRLLFSGDWTWGEITSYTSTTQVTARFYAPFPRSKFDVTTLSDDGATTDFRLGAWSATTGWPAVVAFFEQRAVYAATATQPQTLWFSVTDDYENHAPTDLDSTVVDSGGITYTIAANEINTIQWLVSGQTLLVGTTAAEYQARAASTINEPITARNLVVQRQTAVGSLRYQRPGFVNSATLFIGASSASAHEMTYSFEKDSFVTKDLTIFADHLLKEGGGAEEIVYQEDPYKLIWLRLASGVLACCTYVRDQEVIAWSIHTVATGAVESMCVVPDGDRGENEVLYLVVLSTTGNRVIEQLNVEFPVAADKTTVAERPFVDSWINVDGTSGTLTGLDHLNTRTVDIILDGQYVQSATVSSGQIITGVSLPGIVTVGLRNTWKFKSNPLESGSATGSGRGRVGRIDEVGIVLQGSCFFAYLNERGQVVQYDRYDDGSVYPVYTSLFTGVVKIRTFDTYATEQVVELLSNDTGPFCLIGLAIDHKTNEQ